MKSTQPKATETIFLLDCSGSMQGRVNRQAIAALELCLPKPVGWRYLQHLPFGSNLGIDEQRAACLLAAHARHGAEIRRPGPAISGARNCSRRWNHPDPKSPAPGVRTADHPPHPTARSVMNPPSWNWPASIARPTASSPSASARVQRVPGQGHRPRHRWRGGIHLCRERNR